MPGSELGAGRWCHSSSRMVQITALHPAHGGRLKVKGRHSQHNMAQQAACICRDYRERPMHGWFVIVSLMTLSLVSLVLEWILVAARCASMGSLTAEAGLGLKRSAGSVPIHGVADALCGMLHLQQFKLRYLQISSDSPPSLLTSIFRASCTGSPCSLTVL